MNPALGAALAPSAAVMAATGALLPHLGTVMEVSRAALLRPVESVTTRRTT
jgi:hypothetical protein